MTHCQITYFTAVTTYIGYALLILLGHFKEFLWYLFNVKHNDNDRDGYAPILKGFDNFYIEHLYRYVSDAFNRPISSRPGSTIEVVERISKDGNRSYEYTGKKIKCLNLGSYNYLGFAKNPDHMTKDVFESLEKFGTSSCSPSHEYGYSTVLKQLETEISSFVGKEDAIVIAMGFATNSTIIPTFARKGTLIISDSLNHSSIISGARSSQAKIKVFKHSDYKNLENVVKNAIIEGQPRTHRPWRQIIILVEGIYSMEGEIVDLKEVVRIKKKYKCYLYVDEAHSIGALGKTGRGVCEYHSINPDDVDILMGTFTKSFGSIGGYVASSSKIINHIRKKSYGFIYGNSMNPVCAQQALSALRVISGKDGTNIGKQRLSQLLENTTFFKKGLTDLGFEVIGSDGSPVVCIMLYHPSMISFFSRMALEMNLAVVTVAAPATEIFEGRVRFCLSASHTIDQLEMALKKLSHIGDVSLTKFKQCPSKRIKSILL